MTTPHPIQTTGLTKRYGERLALEELDLTVHAGETFGLLGPNGAGKSTTIAILLGLIRPTGGTARLFGRSVGTAGRELGCRVGVLPERCRLYPRLTATEHLAFAIELHGSDETAHALLARVGLEDAATRRVGEFSTGMSQRLRLALALVGSPNLLILDEPTTGLDPNGIERLRSIIRHERAAGTTVFFSSHQLDHVRAVCDRVGILVDGNLRAVEAVEAYRSGSLVMRFEVADDREELSTVLSSLSAVDSVRLVADNQIIVTVASPERREAVLQTARATVPCSVVSEEGSLAGLFARLAGDRR